MRAGTSDQDLPALLAFLEPVEFIQPGPDAAMLGRRLARLRASAGLSSEPGGCAHRGGRGGIGAAVLTRNVKHFALTPVRIETY